MTRKELLEQFRKNEENLQNAFINELYEDIIFFSELANRKDYQPTIHERITFGKIATIIKNMEKWF